MARVGVAGLDAELAREREAVRARSPPYERALALLPEVLSGREGRWVEAAWAHRTFHAWYDRPLLLLASLRNDALASDRDHPLWDAFVECVPEAVTEERLAAALDPARDRVFEALAHRSVQTNETSRAVAWLWPAALAGASDGARRIALADVGASAGLNLVADALPPIWTTQDGLPVRVAQGVAAAARLGLDAAPLDALDPEHARWLRACIWPGEREREQRLELALAVFRAARVRPDAPVLVPIVASNVPARLDLLSAAEMGVLVLAYQTFVRDDLDRAEREQYEEGMSDWLATHPPGHALWVELELAGDEAEPPVAIVAHVRAPRGGLRTLELARCGFHPTRLEVRHPAAEELRALLAVEAAAGVRA